MNHSPILPILIPFIASLLLLIFGGRKPAVQRGISAISVLVLLAAAVNLILLTDSQAPLSYTLGNWPAPFGIVLVADRLAAMGVMVTAVLAAASLLYASAGFDQKGAYFHAIFQMQLVGINGAFLTGDVFNLFVFFEVMLLASYILLAHGEGLNKLRANFAYVTLNLAGSAVFLIALGMIYGTLGTLNLADIALQLQSVPASEASLVRLAFALLISVFLLKAAVFPLSFWLPHTYAAAGVPVAALFAIMTKVGIVAILRLQVIALAPAEATHDLLGNWLVIAALATIVFSAFGILASKTLQALIAWLVLASAGVLLLVPPLADSAITAAALYYLIQSAIVGAAFFMLAGLIGTARGAAEDKLIAAGRLSNTGLGLAFLLLAATAAGLPPFSGFIGKLMLLSTMSETAQASTIWAVILLSGLVTVIGLAKAGNRLFWETPGEDKIELHQPLAKASPCQNTATFGLITTSVLLLIFAQPISDFTQRAAIQLHQPEHYIQAVIADPEAIERSQKP